MHLYMEEHIRNDYNSNKGRDFTSGNVIKAAFCGYMGVSSVGIISPNIKVIQESCLAASDYFNLYEIKPIMDLSQSI